MDHREAVGHSPPDLGVWRQTAWVGACSPFTDTFSMNLTLSISSLAVLVHLGRSNKVASLGSQINNRNSFLPVLAAERPSQIRSQHSWARVRWLLVSSRGRSRGRTPALSWLRQVHWCPSWGPIFMTPSNSSHLPGTYILNPSHWGWCFNVWILRGYKTFRP